MSISFNHESGLIVVEASIDGPVQQAVLRLALDTGATYSVVDPRMLVAAGYDPATAKERVRMTTASGVEFAPRINVTRFTSLDLEKMDFSIVAHALPPTTTVDGLLGLDFLRGYRLEIDFRNGLLDLS